MARCRPGTRSGASRLTAALPPPAGSAAGPRRAPCDPQVRPARPVPPAPSRRPRPAGPVPPVPSCAAPGAECCHDDDVTSWWSGRQRCHIVVVPRVRARARGRPAAGPAAPRCPHLSHALRDTHLVRGLRRRGRTRGEHPVVRAGAGAPGVAVVVHVPPVHALRPGGQPGQDVPGRGERAGRRAYGRRLVFDTPVSPTTTWAWGSIAAMERPTKTDKTMPRQFTDLAGHRTLVRARLRWRVPAPAVTTCSGRRRPPPSAR
jgi:hypothetical protein